ncbi:GNAT family N-acetyltransferase [Bacillaceae bacterium CLA-AA-H227]|nr:GNAT family N-acetyltransferase [Bacillus yapensis]
MTVEIRKANIHDIPALASLMEQLGYPTTIESMNLRFRHIELNPDYHTFVASINGEVVGMIGLIKSFYYQLDGVYVRIVALVVDSRYRNEGIGKSLVEQAENWAKSLGAIGMSVNSGNRPERVNAHRFYKNMGYVDKSTGFAKSL